MRERSIPPAAIELLQCFGSENRCGGAWSLIFDKAARRRLEEHFGERGSLKHIERWLNVYVVVCDNGNVITAARRTTHLRRHPSTRQVTRHGLR
jgi:hypothetical protein